LHQECDLDVFEARAGELLEPGCVYIAPGDFHLELTRKGIDVRTVLQQKPPENSCRPAVDVLFRSAAATYGAGCLGVVLTGMGQDGKRGAEDIVSAGGRVIAQDAATSTVWGMPRAVVEAGLAESVLPLGSIADAITRATLVGRRVVINT
jgi:two-component system, chemotaxis family, protein-glutamate methylesterase/glutaminase